MHIDPQLVTLIFTIATAVGVLLQAMILFGILLALRATQKKLNGVTERVEDVVLPLVSTTRGLVEDLSPKIKAITTNLVGASDTLRKQAENVGNVVSDVTARTHKQTTRVDSMISGTLDSIGAATASVERNLAGPLRQINGVLAGFRAGVETLRGNQSASTGKPAYKPTRPPASAAAPPVVPASAPAAAYATPMEVVQDVVPDITPEEAREAAARFVRDRAAASERR